MRRYVPLLVVAMAAIAAVVNATVYTYRSLSLSASVTTDTTSVEGSACTGFYYSTSSYGGLPAAGTNYNAEEWGTNTVSVTLQDPTTCSWTDGTNTYELKTGVSISIHPSLGEWYYKDIVGFGYKGGAEDPTVYVFVDVETASGADYAYLVVYKDGTKVGEYDLTATGLISGSIPLDPNQALKLSLKLKYSTQSSDTIDLGFYVSQENEAP